MVLNDFEWLNYLAPHISVGRDLPVGTVLHRQSYLLSRERRVSCPRDAFDPSRGVSATITREFTRAWFGLSPWSNSEFPPGTVYKTNLPGVGASIQRRAPVGVETVAVRGDDPAYWTVVQPAGTELFTLTLIKIGDIAAGTLESSKLPGMDVRFKMTDGVNPAKEAPFYHPLMNGNLTVVAKTCRTPDVNVPMGEQRIDQITTAGKPVDFSLRLLDCPAFHGYYPGVSHAANQLSLRIDPIRDVIDPAMGILGITPAAAGAPSAAVGVGLQIMHPDGRPFVLASKMPSGLRLSGPDGASYAIPLKARYLKTGPKVSPGVANSVATFTIIYE